MLKVIISGFNNDKKVFKDKIGEIMSTNPTNQHNELTYNRI